MIFYKIKTNFFEDNKSSIKYKFFTFYFNYLSYLHFPFICNGTTLPLTITVKLPKR